ncbi:MAG: rRNA adenine N-6-methyltransferase family protein [Crocinitomicaceae bacterium]
MAEKKNKRTFLNTFFTERKQVGAVAPSSRFLVKKMCDKIDFTEAKVIVELGPGTGAFTYELLKRARPDAQIILFELNEVFLEILDQKFDDSRITILNKSAEDVEKVMKQMGHDQVDAILSSLPLTVIPDITKKRIIINSYNILKKGGVYVQYQYSLNAKRLLEMKYGKLEMGFVGVNIPPAFIYVGTK